MINPAANIARHPELALERLLRWKNDPSVIPAHAARLVGVHPTRIFALLRDGHVSLESDGHIHLSSLVSYYRRRVSKRLKAGKTSLQRKTKPATKS